MMSLKNISDKELIRAIIAGYLDPQVIPDQARPKLVKKSLPNSARVVRNWVKIPFAVKGNLTQLTRFRHLR
jgi:hypothetical protein